MRPSFPRGRRTFAGAQPVAIQNRVEPGHLLHGAILRGTILLVCTLPILRFLGGRVIGVVNKLLELLNRNLAVTQVKRPRERNFVGWFLAVGYAFAQCSHRELPRRDQDELHPDGIRLDHLASQMFGPGFLVLLGLGGIEGSNGERRCRRGSTFLRHGF